MRRALDAGKRGDAPATTSMLLPGFESNSSPWREEDIASLAGIGFSFIDLFAGIGGFHGALSALGGTCLWASEIDRAAADLYEANWRLSPAGDIVPFTEPSVSETVPIHDVLAAGFPCQPFSKSGKQFGFKDKTRGTLFFNICQIVEARQPAVVMLENVRNLAGPRQQDTWRTIVSSLRDLGYRVSDEPCVFSPHLLPPEKGGAPQVRERVFILGTRVGQERAWKEADIAPVIQLKPDCGWNPQLWDVSTILEKSDVSGKWSKYGLSENEIRWINAWDDFTGAMLEARNGLRLPGFPIWADALRLEPEIEPMMPKWKSNILAKNSLLYREYQEIIDLWLDRWDGLVDFPPSRRKLEWQAQDEGSIWNCVVHFRPSGLRVKRATYLPALVAITQTSVHGPSRRRITPREAARLQSFPDWFDFGSQSDAETYKQLGNAVSMGAVFHVLRKHIERDQVDLLRIAPHLVASAYHHDYECLLKLEPEAVPVAIG